MLPPYPQYPDLVSINEIEQAFLSDHDMYLQGAVSDMLLLQIYHSQEEDAGDNECELILIVGNYSEEEGITFNSETYTLEEVIRHFKLDRNKAMWFVDRDVPRLLTIEEMRNMGHTEEQIQQILKNREIETHR